MKQINIKKVNAFQCKYTHNDYRRAKVAQLIELQQIEKFYFQGKEISKTMADSITTEYMIKKQNL